MSLYLLDWMESQYKQKPSPAQVQQWLKAQGFSLESPPKIFANGTVQVDLAEDFPELFSQLQVLWEGFAPLEEPADHDQLQIDVVRLLEVQKALQDQPKRSVAEEGVLACMALLLHGYGVKAHG